MTNSTKAKLIGYSTMAAVGLMAESAEAGIVTSTSQGFVPVSIQATDLAAIDFGNGIGTPFQFVGSTAYYNPPSASFVVQTGGVGSNQDIITSGNDPARLAAGYQISPGRSWYGGVTSSGFGNTNNDLAGADAGHWNSYYGSNTVTGFMGIRFSSPALSSGLHYGFFEISYSNKPSFADGTLTILGWAYETTADASITTFELRTVPEPSTLTLAGLGLLACGAAGLRRMRASRKASESTEAA